MFKHLFTRKTPEPEVLKPAVPHWFTPGMLNSTFDELQAAVQETSKLAASISTQLESRLQATEQQLSTILYVVTEGVIVLDCDRIIREWNTGAEIIFGYTKQEVVGKHIDVLAPTPDDVKLIEERFACNNYSETGNINRIREMRNKHKSGRDILVEVSINPFPSTVPGRQNLVAIVRDVTTQHAERALREQERTLMSTVLNSSSDVIIVRNAAGRWIMINQAAKHLYSFVSDSNFYMKTHMEIAEEFPEFKEHFLESMSTDAEAWKSRKTLRTEAVVVDGNSQRQYFDVMKTPIFDKNGDREMIVITARNITSIKEKREHITVAYKALNASSDIITITDNTGNIIFANRMFLIKYRFTDGRAVHGRNMSTVQSPQTPKHVYDQMWETVKIGKVWEGVLTNCDTLGNPVTTSTTVIPIVDQHLDTSYYITVQKLLA